MVPAILGYVAALLLGAVGIGIGILVGQRVRTLAAYHNVPYPDLTGAAIAVLGISGFISGMLYAGGHRLAAYVVIGDGIGVLLSGAVFFALIRGLQRTAKYVRSQRM